MRTDQELKEYAVLMYSQQLKIVTKPISSFTFKFEASRTVYKLSREEAIKLYFFYKAYLNMVHVFIRDFKGPTPDYMLKAIYLEENPTEKANESSN